MSLMDQVMATFVEEAAERLAELEAALLELERNPGDAELVAQAFRAMHTIKGSAAMVGLEAVASFTHELETVFDDVRAGRLPVTKPLIDIGLGAKDCIRRLLAEGPDVAADERARLVEALRELQPSAKPAPESGSAPGGPTGEKIYRILFQPGPELFDNGTNPLGLLDELGELGSTLVVARTGAIPALADMDPETCYLWWDVLVSTRRGSEALRDVFAFVEDHATIRIDEVDDGTADDTTYKRIGEILVDRGDITTEQLREALARQRRVGEVLVEGGAVAPEAVAAAAIEQKVVREARGRREALRGDEAASIRVPARKLDRLVDLVGEMVIAQATLSDLAGRLGIAELRDVAETLERLGGELRDTTLDVRMVPIGTTFGRFKRLVRDLAAELGKQIELVTEGAETELDKTVIERLGDPLVHLIRNSCDHGIEEPDVRLAAGKPVRGTVRLSAHHAGPSVFVEVHDDGAGLDLEAVRRRALDLGLVAPEAQLSDRELSRLIFLPGFSTAREVSSISGRGVGLDVVKRSIDALRGSVDIDTRRGVGTTIRLRLPLTLAIIDGLLVSVADARYVLPMTLVEECVQLTRAEYERSNGAHLASVRGRPVPYVRLRERFGVSGGRPDDEQIVITSIDGTRVGFAVDSVVGQHQTVIKSLGAMCRDADGVTGATILADGGIALIIDVPALIRSATEQVEAAH